MNRATLADMTAAPLELPEQWPKQPLTVGEYLALGETALRTELHEGLLTVSPSPLLRHIKASRRLANAIEDAVAPHYEVYNDADVNLQLAAPDEPGFVPTPDVVVAHADAALRLEEQGGVLRASDVILAVEIISPSSRKMDRVLKRDEYADAGIPHYWIVDLNEPISILACHLAGELGYADDGEVTGTFRTTVPFSFELDLSRLTGRAS